MLAEDRRPPESVWLGPLVSSRLLEYEVWVRINDRKLADSHGEAVRQILGRIAFIELSPPVLSRALEPFPSGVRTLDALHLASADFLRSSRIPFTIATYDHRMMELASGMKIPIFELP